MQRNAAAVAVLLLSSPLGCGPVEFLEVVAETLRGPLLHSEIEFVGKSATGVYVVRSAVEENAVPGSPTLVPHDVWHVKVDTLQLELVSDLPAFPFDIAASDGYLVWIDRDAGQLLIRDRESGTEFVGFERSSLLADGAGSFDLRGIADDQAVLWIGLGRDVIPANEEFIYILVDLETGEQIRIEQVGGIFVEGYAKGAENQFVIERDHVGRTDVRISEEFVKQIEIIDLTTGNRQVIADEERTRGGDQLFFEDGRIYWAKYEPGSFSTRVISYDVQQKRTSKVITDLGSRDISFYLADYDAGRFLFERWTGSGSPYWADSSMLQIRRAGGRKQTVTESDHPVFLAQCQIVGNCVVYSDLETDALTVFDMTTGQRTVIPIPAE